MKVVDEVNLRINEIAATANSMAQTMYREQEEFALAGIAFRRFAEKMALLVPYLVRLDAVAEAAREYHERMHREGRCPGGPECETLRDLVGREP